MEYQKLWEAAQRVRENAYAPYSEYKVGAALLSDDGEIYTGCNVENASFPVTVCAERGALSCAVARGARRFIAIALCAGGQAVTPCGLCRQALAEFGEMDVLCPDGAGGYRTFLLSELLPHGFSDFREEK